MKNFQEFLSWKIAYRPAAFFFIVICNFPDALRRLYSGSKDAHHHLYLLSYQEQYPRPRVPKKRNKLTHTERKCTVWELTFLCPSFIFDTGEPGCTELFFHPLFSCSSHSFLIPSLSVSTTGRSCHTWSSFNAKPALCLCTSWARRLPESLHSFHTLHSIRWRKHSLNALSCNRSLLAFLFD